jgi:transposase
MVGRRKWWIPERRERVIALMRAGAFPRAIAGELGTTPKAVAAFVQRLRQDGTLPPPRPTMLRPKSGPSWWNDERRELALDLTAAGYGPSEAARRLGATKNAIIGFLDRARARDEPRAFRETDDGGELPSLDERLGFSRVIATGCRWIEGDPRGDWDWCRAPTILGSSWCGPHWSQVFSKTG